MRLQASACRAATLALGLALLAMPSAAVSERTFKKTVFEGKKQQAAELGGEIAYDYTLELKPTLAQPECRADVSISYIPMYDKVRVDTTVEHDGCPASSGDYRLQIRTRGTDGETATNDVHESWQRTEAGSVVTTALYPLDIDRELVWVRVRTSRKTNCRCDASVPLHEGTTPANP